ncbi:Fur family transcriptional regulator [Serratia odorifera]|nr:Fur family transcriptional regulator [Serratia odorifera]RII71445.1 Fur family transcriptional regulator [Serratia odorifera]
MNGAHNMKPGKPCQRLICITRSSAEKAAKSARLSLQNPLKR